MASKYAKRHHAIRSAILISITTMLLTIPGIAQAVPQGAFWVENTVIDSVADVVDLTGFRSFDLYVQLEAGDVITAADFGVAGPNSGLSTTQTIFEHPFGGDTAPNAAFLGAFPDLAYDTILRMGNLDGSASQITVQNFDFSNPAALSAVWNPNAPGGFTEALPDASNAIILATITASSDGISMYLGGQLFLSGEGPNGTFGREIATNGVVDVPNAFGFGNPEPPTPGAASILTIAGAFASRRKRINS